MPTPLFVLIVLAVGLIFIFIYNRMIQLRNLVKNSFSQIDIQLKRRYDLIPNLVEAVKAYMQHEKETLEKVITARDQAANIYRSVTQNPSDGDQMKKLLECESQLTQSLQRLAVVVEAYPDLKANTNISQLMEELTSTENRISFARQAYNDSVMDYNNYLEMFPHSFIANTFRFKTATNFEIMEPTERINIKVSF